MDPPEGIDDAASQSQVAVLPGLSQRCSLKHRLKIVKAIFFLLGIGILLPWNAFISAAAYFQKRFCSDEGYDEVNFELWFGLIWNIASIISLGGMITFRIFRDKYKQPDGIDNPHNNSSSSSSSNSINDGAVTGYNSAGVSTEPVQTPTADSVAPDEITQNENDDQSSSYVMVMASLGIYLICFLGSQILVLIPNMDSTDFSELTLSGVAVCGMFGAVANAGIVAAAGVYSPEVGLAPFFSGQAIGGLAISMVNFGAAMSEDASTFIDENCEAVTEFIIFTGHARQLQTCQQYKQIDWGTFFFFLFGSGVLVACMFGFHFIHKYQSMLPPDPYEQIGPAESINEDHGHVGSPRIGLELHREQEQVRRQQRFQDYPAGETSGALHQSHEDTIANEVETNAEHLENDELQSHESSQLTAQVWAAVRGPAFSIFGVFTVTLSIFPGWVSQLQSSHRCEGKSRLFDDLYTPYIFVIFNAGDLIGRLLASSLRLSEGRRGSTQLVILTAFRVVFFPLFLLSVALHGENSMSVRSDAYFFIVMMLFSISNGLFISWSFIHAPSLIPGTTKVQEISSEILSFAVSFGLLSGSILSFPFTSIANGL